MENVSIVIVDKNFNVQNLQGLVIRSEKYANKIKIQFPKTYEGEDLTGKIFILKCTNANGVYFETLLPKTITAEYIELLWTVTAEFTTVSGVLKIAIFAESANYSLGTTMSKVIVEESPQYSIPIDDFTVLESYMVEIRVAVDEVERDRAEALESKNVAVSARDEAVTAKDLAVPASVTAVDAKDIAVTARDEAVEAKDIAVEAKDIAEVAKSTAVSAKTEAESASVAAVEAKDIAVPASVAAVEAKDIAVPASVAAVEAKDIAESAKSTAVNASITAVTAKDEAVSASVTAVESKNVAVSAKDEAAISQADALTSKNTAAASQSAAETAKTAAEAARDAAALSQAGALASKNTAAASQSAAETAKTGAEAARDAAALSQAGALASKNTAAASQSAAETAKTGAEAARDIAVTAADDAVTRMAAYEGGAIAVQVETNKNEISVIKNYLNSSRYGVVFSGSNPQGTRVEDAVGMIANVAVDDQIVVNDFDSIPFFNRRICCGTHDVNGNFIVNAYRDEPGFVWDGTNGEVYYEETPFYWTGDMNNYVSVSAVPLDGYTLSPRFRNGTDKEYSPVFWASTVAGKPTSRAGVFADYGSVNSLMASAKLYHARAHTETMAARMSDYILQLVEFATKDPQTIMMGAANMAYSGPYTAVIAETGVNRIIVSNASAANFVIGQTISIGANADSDTVAKNRVITGITAHDGSNKAIAFDGAPVNIAIGNVVASRPWKNGATNIIKASSGSIVSNSDGRYPCIWRGKVSPWAETYSAICDMLVKKEGAAAPFSYIPYYLPDPIKYAAGALTADYIRLNYETAKENGYAKTLGIDPEYPHVRLPDAVGASSTTYLSAYFYIVNDSVEIRAVLVGGPLYVGRPCSPVYFSCYPAPSISIWYRASRLFVSRV